MNKQAQLLWRANTVQIEAHGGGSAVALVISDWKTTSGALNVSTDHLV